jgi:leader peptidase (prepilin peptidase) / N-methyltransferase
MLHRIVHTFPPSRTGTLRAAGWGLAVLCAVAASILIVPGKAGLFGAGLATVMMAIAAIDAREFRIPNELVLVGVLLGLVEAAIVEPRPFAALTNAVLRGTVLAFLLLGFRFAYRFFRHREGLGLGDVKLSAVAGIWLSWTAASLAIEFAALVALTTVLISSLGGKRISGATRIPFGLFFAPAIWCAWLSDATILHRSI